MCNITVRNDIVFSNRYQELHVITDEDISVQNIMEEYGKVSELRIYEQDEFVIIETDERAYGLPISVAYKNV